MSLPDYIPLDEFRNLDWMSSRFSRPERASYIKDLEQKISDIQALLGTPEGDRNLGQFTGTTIPDNATLKVVLQALENALQEVFTEAPVIASEVEAREGTNSTKVMSPLRVAQAIAERLVFASGEEAETGTSTTKVMSPATVVQAIALLAKSNGASKVGFKQIGTNTVTRTVQAKSAEVVSVTDWGAKLNGVDDDTAAFKRAIAECAGKRLIIPNGTPRITETIPINVDYFSLEGQGPANTAFLRAGDFGDTFDVRRPDESAGALNQTSLAGFAINSVTRPTSGTHIRAEAVNGLRLFDLDLNDPYEAMTFMGVYDAILEDIKATFQEGDSLNRKGLLLVPANAEYGGGLCANISFNKLKINSIWTPSSSGVPGLSSAIHATAVDGLWGSDFYFGSSDQPLVKLENSSGKYLTGIKLSNGWLDHGTSVLFQTLGSVEENFGDVSLNAVRMFGGGLTTALVELLGNAKDILLAGIQANASKGNLVSIGLSGSGGRAQILGGSYRQPNYDGAGGTPIRIVGGKSISVVGAHLDGGGTAPSCVYVNGGDGVNISGCNMYNAASPIGFDAGATNYTAVGNMGSGFTSPAIGDYGSGSRVVANNNFF